MDLLLGIIVASTIISLIAFVFVVSFLVKSHFIINDYYLKSSCLKKYPQKISFDPNYLFISGFLCVVLPVVAIIVGPQFDLSHCLSRHKEAMANISRNPISNRANTTSSLTFSVLSWNILFAHDLNGRDTLPCIAEVLNTLKPDVSAFQESNALVPFFGEKDILNYISGKLHVTGYPGIEGLQSSTGVSMASSFEVSNHQRYILPEDEQQTFAHYSLVQIDCTIDNHLVSIFALHAAYKNHTATPENPSPYSELSAAQMRFIAKKANEASLTQPTIVMGDFNTNPNEVELDTFFDAGFSMALHRNRRLTPPSTYVREFALRDHIFFKDLTLLQSSVITQASNISDHYPIMAQFQILASCNFTKNQESCMN